MLGSAIFGPTILAIAGNYDDVNRLCTQVADRFGWGFVNINLRSYYAEGAKTLGFEVVEQLGWRFPHHLVSPVAGGTLLPRIGRGLREFRQIGLVNGELPKIHAAQAAGCAPVANALLTGADELELVRPNTIAKSIAIGNPADGQQVLQTVRSTGGTGTKVSDDKIVAAIRLLAETEGIFTEPAGGTTLAGTIDLIERGVIKRNESVVVCVTGNGYKTTEVVSGQLDGAGSSQPRRSRTSKAGGNRAGARSAQRKRRRLERKSKAGVKRARRLDGRDRSERRAGHRLFFDFVLRVQQIEDIEYDVEACRARRRSSFEAACRPFR